MHCPKVAVIMPCYNSGKYLAQTIESVLNQSYQDYQFIAGNDGSSDNTAEILGDYADRITVVNHPDFGNHGQAATYNLCLKHANAEYIAFIDNDDLWHPDKLQKQVEVLDSNPDVGLVYTNGNVIDGNNKPLYSFFGSSHQETNEVGAVLLDCYIRTPSTVMVRSSVLQAAGAFEEGIIPDHDMWIRIKELANFYYINENIFSYRIHNEQLSHTSAEKMWRDGFGTLERAMNRYPYPSYIRRKRLAVINYRLGALSIKKRNLSSIGYFLLACFYDPFRAFNKITKANN